MERLDDICRVSSESEDADRAEGMCRLCKGDAVTNETDGNRRFRACTTCARSGGGGSGGSGMKVVVVVQTGRVPTYGALASRSETWPKELLNAMGR